MSSNPSLYELERVFYAHVDQVWQAWSRPELISRWYGPNVETIIHKFDFRAGGVWLNEMSWLDKEGKPCSDFSKMAFIEIEKHAKIIWHHASVDKDWKSFTNPMMPDWPRLLLTTFTFEEITGVETPTTTSATKVCLQQIPLDANDKENACFANMIPHMNNGWNAGYKIIDEILEELSP